MVFVPPKDRVMETSISNSQTVFALAGAVDASFNRFSAAMAVNDTTLGAVVEPGVAFAAGVLTYSATNQVTVTTALDSKGTFSSGGTKEVFMGLPAARAAMLIDATGAPDQVRYGTAQSLTSTQQRQARSNVGVDVTTLSKSANYTIAAADYGALIKLSGSPVISLTAAASLGDGWKCDFRNTSTGMPVIDPNGSETVNGKTTFNVYPGENFRLICDGVGFHTIGTGTGLVLMDTKTASAASTMDFTRSDTDRFGKIEFVFEGLYPSASADSLSVRVSGDGGATWISSASYGWQVLYNTSGTIVGANPSPGNTKFDLLTQQGSDAGYSVIGSVAFNMTSGGWTFFDGKHSSIDTSSLNRRIITVTGQIGSTANAWRFFYSTGSINGTIRQYGYTR